MYDTLAKLPIVVYDEISSSGNLSLLLQEGEKLSEEELADLWQALSIAFSEKNESADSKKVFRLTREIESYRCKHKAITIMLECLKFDWDNELVAKFREWGYRVEQATYWDDLDRIAREAESLQAKISNLETMLPKADGAPKTGIYDVLSSYSAILGIDFDFEAISCLKYISMQKQVASKIKASEQNNSIPKHNSKRRR